MMENFKVGDKVTIMGHYGGALGVSVVTVASPRKISLKNGTEWAANGLREWGSASDRWYMGRYLVHFKPEHSEDIFRRRALGVLNKMNWEKLPTQILQNVLAAIPDTYKPGTAVTEKAATDKKAGE